MTDYITIKMPLAHWRQLVSDYEDMCGVGEDEIEILQDVTEVADDCRCTYCGQCKHDHEGWAHKWNEACPFTHSHTRQWCGYSECREV